MTDIARCLPEGGDWCSLEKAQSLAALVVGLRPRVVCEIGVWMGGSLVPMLLAMRAVELLEHEAMDVDAAVRRASRTQGPDEEAAAAHAAKFTSVRRRVVAIDPWSAPASCEGQGSEDAAWWSTVDHDEALRVLLARISRHGVAALCEVVRERSDVAQVPPRIDLLHVDGNHADQAMRDVQRFAGAVPVGGILVLDDVEWRGGHVARAHEHARATGFVDLYPVDTGIVMQRIRND